MDKFIVQLFITVVSIYTLPGCASSSKVNHSRFGIYYQGGTEEALNGKSKIVGRIIDINTRKPLLYANVIIIPSTFGAVSDINGVYQCSGLPPGTYNVKVSMIAYEPDTDLPPVYVPVRSLVFLFRHWQAEGDRMSPVPVACNPMNCVV